MPLPYLAFSRFWCQFIVFAFQLHYLRLHQHVVLSENNYERDYLVDGIMSKWDERRYQETYLLFYARAGLIFRPQIRKLGCLLLASPYKA